LTIRFAPTTQNDYLGNLDIPSNDSDAGLLTATLAGKGRALNASITDVAMVGPQTVRVIVSVRDRFNTPVTTLAASNFSIVENGLTQAILNVSNTVKRPVSVGMVLDYSSSMIPYTTNLENAAKSFVDLLDPVTDEAEVIKFAALIAVMQPFTQDNVALKDAIDALFPYERRGTVLYPALDNSINSISLRSNPQRAIIAVSDGNASGSTIKRDDVIANAIYNNVQIFTIGIGLADNVTLQTLATETGGQYFYSPTASDLTTVYSTISEILSNEYTIEYTTSSAAGSTISLDVMVDDNGQLGEYSRTVDL
jgi:VWFA-related protein